MSTHTARFSNVRSHIGSAFDGAGKASIGVSAVGAGLGILFNAVSANREQKSFMEELVEEYRQEISEQLGRSPEQVTTEDLVQATEQYPVLAQAREASKIDQKTKLVSAVVGGATGFVTGIGAAALAAKKTPALVPEEGDDPKEIAEKYEANKRNAAGIAGGIASSMAAMFSGKFSRKLLHRNSEVTLSLDETAHGEIMAIKAKQQRGEEVDKRDVFHVMLALQPQVQEAIYQECGMSFKELDAASQEALLTTGFAPFVEDMNTMATRINQGARPQGLLFGEIKEVYPEQNRAAVLADAAEQQMQREEEKERATDRSESEDVPSEEVQAAPETPDAPEAEVPPQAEPDGEEDRALTGTPVPTEAQSQTPTPPSSPEEGPAAPETDVQPEMDGDDEPDIRADDDHEPEGHEPAEEREREDELTQEELAATIAELAGSEALPPHLQKILQEGPKQQEGSHAADIEQRRAAMEAEESQGIGTS